MSTDSFPRRSALTRGFRLGAPRTFAISANGARVLFLRSRNGTDSVNCLWVLDVATGFLMMKREMIEKMYEYYKEELFAVNDIQGQNVDNYIAIFACSIDEKTKRFLSEDYAFCRRWQKMGGDVWADISTPLSHTGTHVFSGNILGLSFYNHAV